MVVTIAGTSTGGILAAALGMNGYDGKKCVKLYEDLIPKVFYKSLMQKILSKIPNRAAYKYENLEAQLKDHFPSKEVWTFLSTHHENGQNE